LPKGGDADVDNRLGTLVLVVDVDLLLYLYFKFLVCIILLSMDEYGHDPEWLSWESEDEAISLEMDSVFYQENVVMVERERLTSREDERVMIADQAPTYAKIAVQTAVKVALTIFDKSVADRMEQNLTQLLDGREVEIVTHMCRKDLWPRTDFRDGMQMVTLDSLLRYLKVGWGDILQPELGIKLTGLFREIEEQITEIGYSQPGGFVTRLDMIQYYKGMAERHLSKLFESAYTFLDRHFYHVFNTAGSLRRTLQYIVIHNIIPNLDEFGNLQEDVDDDDEFSWF
jgi:hypothetical protein